MSFFTSGDGVRLSYRTAGIAEREGIIPLLLVHGFPLRSSLWDKIIAPLAGHGLVILPDLRGFGGSTISAGPYTMERLGNDLAALLQHLKIERAYVAGHSMGGYAALALAEAAPEKVAGLALVHSHPFADNEAQRKRRYEVEGQLGGMQRGEWNRNMAAQLSDDEGAVSDVEAMIASADRRAIVNAAVGMALRPSRAHVWREAAGKALLIAGENDRLIPMERVEDVRREHPSAAVSVLPGGHVSMLERPAELADILGHWWVG